MCWCETLLKVELVLYSTVFSKHWVVHHKETGNAPKSKHRTLSFDLSFGIHILSEYCDLDQWFDLNLFYWKKMGNIAVLTPLDIKDFCEEYISKVGKQCNTFVCKHLSKSNDYGRITSCLLNPLTSGGNLVKIFAPVESQASCHIRTVWQDSRLLTAYLYISPWYP